MKKILFITVIVMMIAGISFMLYSSRDTSKMNAEKEEIIKDNKESKKQEEPAIIEKGVSTDIVDKPIEKENIVESNSKVEKKDNPVNSEVPKKEKEEVSYPKNDNKGTEEIKVPVTEKKKIWDELGITEYDYYHKPMWNWARVDFSIDKYKTKEATMKACQEKGQEIFEQGLGYSCSNINSYSGDYLGEMLETF